MKLKTFKQFKNNAVDNTALEGAVICNDRGLDLLIAFCLPKQLVGIRGGTYGFPLMATKPYDNLADLIVKEMIKDSAPDGYIPTAKQLEHIHFLNRDVAHPYFVYSDFKMIGIESEIDEDYF